MYADLERKLLLQSIPMDLHRVRQAYAFADEVHDGQYRKTGEPYIIHPLAVAELVAEIGGDEDMVIAALLHDTVEDGADHEAIGETIEERFGRSVYYMVMALSKNCTIACKDRRQTEYVNQMAEAIESDTSVFFIKMADLIHNLQTLEGLSPDCKQKWVDELKTQYIPMLQEHYHRLSLPYHDMYFRLIEKLENLVCGMGENATVSV